MASGTLSSGTPAVASESVSLNLSFAFSGKSSYYRGKTVPDNTRAAFCQLCNPSKKGRSFPTGSSKNSNAESCQSGLGHRPIPDTSIHPSLWEVGCSCLTGQASSWKGRWTTRGEEEVPKGRLGSQTPSRRSQHQQK